VIVVRYLHLLFAFLYAGSLIGAHWNTISARKRADWRERAALFAANRRLGMLAALPGLVLLGVAGNLLAMQLGFHMGASVSLTVVNVLWLACLLAALIVELPAGAALAALARAAAEDPGAAAGGAAPAGREPAGFAGELGRWRLANGIQLVLFVILLGFMVAPWR
jgi:hypothetical protein